MHMIVGLGNPGRQYEESKHNTGFRVVDELAKRWNVTLWQDKMDALVAQTTVNGEKIILVKPQTYMNLSGESVRDVIDFYKIDEKEELIVVSDDISLDVGQIRIRKKGSAGGHNGLKNIIQHLGHDEFQRVKMGVGEKPQGRDLADYVLGHFSKEERSIMDESAGRAAEAIEVMITEGPDKAMNLFNKKI